MATIASLRVELTAQTRRFQTSMREASESVTRFARNASLVATGTAAALGAMFGKAVADADNLQNLAVRLGTTTEALSELRYVAAQSGIDFNTFSTAMQRMVRRIDEVARTGKGTAAPALERLGLDAEKLNKLTVDKRFEAISQAMFRLRDQSERVRLAMALFDTEGVKLVQTMTQGAAGIRAARAEAREMGITLDTSTAKSAQDVANAFGKMTDTITAAGQQLLLRFAPDVAKALDAANGFIKTHVKGTIDGLETMIRDGWQMASLAVDIVALNIRRAFDGDVAGAFSSLTRLTDILTGALGRALDGLRKMLDPPTNGGFSAVIDMFERGLRVIKAVIDATGTLFGAGAAVGEQLLQGNFAGAAAVSRRAIPDAADAFTSTLLKENGGADLQPLQRTNEEQVRVLRSIEGKLVTFGVAQ